MVAEPQPLRPGQITLDVNTMTLAQIMAIEKRTGISSKRWGDDDAYFGVLAHALMIEVLGTSEAEADAMTMADLNARFKLDDSGDPSDP